MTEVFSPAPKPSPLPVKPRKPVAKGKRPRARNTERYSVEWLRHYHSLEHVLWTAAQPCTVGCVADKRHNHHVVSKGAGGTFEDVIPLCEPHHRQLHNIGRESFEKIYHLNLADAAKEHARLWRIVSGEE